MQRRYRTRSAPRSSKVRTLDFREGLKPYSHLALRPSLCWSLFAWVDTNSAKHDQGSNHVEETHGSSTHGPCSFFNQDGRSSSPLPLEIDLTPGHQFHPENVYRSHFSQEDIEAPRGRPRLSCMPRIRAKMPLCNVHVAHHVCLVIAINGAYLNNGNGEARSAIWVYHGYDSEFNITHILDGLVRHTNQIAELEACARALPNAIIIHAEWEMAGDCLKAVVIKSDSEYVVRGLTEWLPKWKENGWENVEGSPVANSTYFQRIERLVEQLEQDISVKGWMVPRERNWIADGLAEAALEGNGIGQQFYPV